MIFKVELTFLLYILILIQQMSIKLYTPVSQGSAGVKCELFTKFIDLPVEFERVSFADIK